MNTIYLYDTSAAVKSGAYSNTGGAKPRKDYNITHSLLADYTHSLIDLQLM